MTKPGVGQAPPGLEGQKEVTWPIVIGLTLLLPVLEWGDVRLLKASGFPLTTASLWAIKLFVNAIFVAVLMGTAGRAVRAMWSRPNLKDIGLTMGALVAGWVVIPMAQWGASMIVTAGGTGVGTKISLVPLTGLDMMLLASTSVVGAFSQEMIYRGLLWERTEAISGNRWVALVCTSLVFGLVYASAGMVKYLSIGVAWGLVAGALFLLTRRLSALVLLNTLNTFLAYAVLFKNI